MKVWVIWNEKENNNKSIDKIFSTEEKALEYIEKVKGGHNSDRYIEEFELDQL
ncbi:MAG: hypothetical protein MUO21_00060 [Nitrososphaeraceae archaeon]|nr:hypothetical protein [Nitrososphaeraceae archaeon]